MKNQSFRAILHSCLKIVRYSVNILFPKNPHKVIFMSGPDDYIDNSRALSDYILSRNDLSQYKIYWVFRNRNVKNVDSRIHPIYLSEKLGHLKYFFHTVTSKYLFSTHGAFDWVCHYVQIYLCLWHGTMLKRIAYMQDPIRNKYYMQHCYLFASPSKFYNSIVAGSFNKKEKDVVTTGYPRVDLLFQDSDVLEKLNIDKSTCKKIVLYMPTFRQAISSEYKETSLNVFKNELINFSDDESLEEWNDYLSSLGILLIVKSHPSDNNIPKRISLPYIRMIDNQELADADVQLYHLLHYADSLITDFSSVFCDYMVLDKPIGFIITDIDEYRIGRGFVFDSPVDYMPGVIIQDKENFKLFFYNVANAIDESKKKRDLLKTIYNEYFDGNNCSRVLKTVGIQ